MLGVRSSLGFPTRWITDRTIEIQHFRRWVHPHLIRRNHTIRFRIMDRGRTTTRFRAINRYLDSIRCQVIGCLLNIIPSKNTIRFPDTIRFLCTTRFPIIILFRDTIPSASTIGRLVASSPVNGDLQRSGDRIFFETIAWTIDNLPNRSKIDLPQ